MYRSLLSSFSFGALLSACVTINIYFPAAAAEDAARVIVRDVLSNDVSVETNDQSNNLEFHTANQFAAILINFIIAPAHAEADININTPIIAALRSSMKKRAVALKEYYASGAVGLTANANVQVRDQSLIPLKDRNSVKKLVADENKDRSALYAEIARANNHPEWENQIRSTFSRVWVEEVAAGTWYQNNGAWVQK